MMNESPKDPREQNQMQMNDDNLKEIWRCQPVEGIKMSAEQIRKRAGSFEKKIMWRNVREYISGGIAAVLFVYFIATNHDPLFRAACVVMIVGLAYVAWQLHRKGSAKSVPEEMGAASSLQFYRKQLERQRDMAASVWSWYLAPLVPGLILFAISSALADPRPRKLIFLALFYGFSAGLFVFIWKLNARGARCLQRMIDELHDAENTGLQS
jgi:Flp pilus assembly protein TadB